jgi:hypothetical protein
MDSFYENAAEDTAPPPLPSISIKMQPEMEETTEPFSFAPAPADSNDVAGGDDDDDVTASINPKDDAEWTGEDEVGSGSNESPVSKPPPKKVSHFKQGCLLSLSLFLVSSSRYFSPMPALTQRHCSNLIIRYRGEYRQPKPLPATVHRHLLLALPCLATDLEEV